MLEGIFLFLFRLWKNNWQVDTWESLTLNSGSPIHGPEINFYGLISTYPKGMLYYIFFSFSVFLPLQYSFQSDIVKQMQGTGVLFPKDVFSNLKRNS